MLKAVLRDDEIARIEKRALSIPEILDWGDENSMDDPESDSYKIEIFFTGARDYVLNLIAMHRKQQSEITKLKARIQELEIAQIKSLT